SLLEGRTPEELMLEASTSTVPAKFGSCHSVGHIIGDETYKKYRDVEGSMVRCGSTCSNACIHGVMGAAVTDILGTQYDEDIAHADLGEIKSIGGKYCYQTSLCHGIGHILYIATDDFTSALEGCDSVSEHQSREVCHQGVFMQGLGGVDQSLIVGD